jgi:hypothetical protein
VDAFLLQGKAKDGHFVNQINFQQKKKHIRKIEAKRAKWKKSNMRKQVALLSLDFDWSIPCKQKKIQFFATSKNNKLLASKMVKSDSKIIMLLRSVQNTDTLCIRDFALHRLEEARLLFLGHF